MGSSFGRIGDLNDKIYRKLGPEVVAIWSECVGNAEDIAKHFSSFYLNALCLVILNKPPNLSQVRAVGEITYDCLGKPSCLANKVRIRYFLAKSLDQISSE